MVNHLHISNNREGASEFLVDHKSKDTHHSGTSVVQLNSTLLNLGLFVELVPGTLEGTVSEISGELISKSIHVLHDGNLKKANEGEDLNGTLDRDGVSAVDGGPAVGVRVERMSSGVNVSSEVSSSTGDDVTQESKLSNTSVLDLDVTETVETALTGLVEESEGIPESDRGLGAEFGFERREGGGGLRDGGRGEGGGGGEGGGEDDGLHGWKGF
mmetsp:Transcript_20838/g.32772  ORF Transcript_20838/g.32772 Transcript_20838/m.32772 type:complete len:214 (-) Transcript_20838:57-698(-)